MGRIETEGGRMGGVIVILASLLIVLTPASPLAYDPENCLKCHRYPNLFYLEGDGDLSSYSIREEYFTLSVHRKIACTECHKGILSIPHEEQRVRVYCGTECHLLEPFTGTPYSHRKIVEQYRNSVHGPGSRRPLEKEKPGCTFCHRNEKVHEFTEFVNNPPLLLERCVNCHSREDIEKVYNHFIHRQLKRHTRKSREISDLCFDCHRDREYMERFQVSEKTLKLGETYPHNIHGLLVSLGSDRAATCVDCHTVHDIRSKDDPKALIYQGPGKLPSDILPAQIEGLVPVISPCGRLDCHPDATESFAMIEQHPDVENPERLILFLVKQFFFWLTTGLVFSLFSIILLEILNELVREARKLIKVKGHGE